MADARVSNIAGEVHAASPGEARITVLAPEVHGASPGQAQISVIALEVHSNLPSTSAAQVSIIVPEVHLSANPMAMVSALYIEVHTSVKEAPMLVPPVLPNEAITERLEWMTDVITNYDGSEQRISIRPYPRRSFNYSYAIMNDEERRRFYSVYYQTAQIEIFAPAYPYQGYVQALAPQGERDVYFNVSRSDLRPNDGVMFQLRDGTTFIYRVQDIYNDHIRIGRPLDVAIPKGSIAVPLFEARHSKDPSLGMLSVSGSSQLTLNVVNVRQNEAHPINPVTLPMFNGYVVLDRRPMAEGEAIDDFSAGMKSIDNGTAIPFFYSAWDQIYVGGVRQYLINKLVDWPEMQFWRTFLDYCRGQQNPFLTPTYREDLVLAPGQVLQQESITVAGLDYDQVYAEVPTYSRLEIETDMGIHRVVVAGVSRDEANTIITFQDAIPEDVTGATIVRISFLMLVRLASDAATLIHRGTFSTVDLTIRAVKE